MSHTVKIFCSGADQNRLVEAIPVIERYQGFILATLEEAQLAELAKRYPIEDISTQFDLPAGQRSIDTSQPRLDAKGRTKAHPDYKGEKKLKGGAHHYLVQFIGPIKAEWLQEVEACGGKLQAPHAAFSYVVRADEKQIAKIAALDSVRWCGHLSHKDRVAANLGGGVKRKADDVWAELPRSRVLPGLLSLSFFDQESLKAAKAEIKALGCQIEQSSADACQMVVALPKGRASAKLIRDLSAVHGVRAIREQSLKRPSNDVAATIMASAATLGSERLALDGAGEIVGVCDTGLDTGTAATINADFQGRIKSILSYPITSYFANYINNPGGNDGAADLDSGHGTHVTGSVLGDGTNSAGLSGLQGPIRGLAHKAKLVFQAVEQELQWKNPAYNQSIGRYLLAGIPDDITVLFSDAYTRGVRVHSNSWGGGDPGAYDAQSEQLDRFVWQNPDFCVLVAAGNDGSDSDGDGKINPMSVTSPSTAKNCLCIGASENLRTNFNSQHYGSWWPSDYPAAPYKDAAMADNPEQVVAFSSRGPSEDGRICPDLVAPGTYILSTRSSMIASNNNAWAALAGSRNYFHMGGTSMATPLAAGAATLVRQYLRRDQGIANPSAALIKATLIAGAKRLPGYSSDAAVADNDQGFGRIDLDAALAPVEPASAEYIDVSEGLSSGELWSKEIAIQGDALPLKVVMAYSDYPGAQLVNNLNLILTAPDGSRFVGNIAGDGSLRMDASNNVEKVVVAKPMPGNWKIEVVASNVPQPSQPFALVVIAALGEPAVSNDLIRVERTPALAIPDRKPAGVSDTISLTQGGGVKTVAVEVDISHTYIGDLIVSLISPEGDSVLLHNRSGASSNDIQKRYDLGTTPELALFNGRSIAGDWTLRVSDNAPVDTGTLNSWALEILPSVDRWVVLNSSPGVQIPDNNPAGIQDSLLVEQGGVVQEIEVSVDITHTYIGDLQLELSAPSGKTVTLHNRTGSYRDNIIQTYDVSTLPDLQTLLGESVTGSWSLMVSDNAGRDVGKLNSWGLRIKL